MGGWGPDDEVHARLVRVIGGRGHDNFFLRCAPLVLTPVLQDELGAVVLLDPAALHSTRACMAATRLASLHVGRIGPVARLSSSLS